MDAALIEHLEKTFPDRCPAWDADEREKCYMAGNQAVVAHLKALMAKQDKNLLEN